MSDISLEDAVNGTTTEPEVQEEVKAEPEVKAEEPTGETETSPPEVEAKTDEPDPVEGLKAGITAERHKRQEAEQQLEQYKAYLAQQQQGQQEKPDFWENPEKVLGSYAQNLQQQMQQMQTNLSVEMMKTVHQDYDDMESKFVEMAKANPALIAQMNQSGNPAKFAYDTAKAKTEVEQMSDPNYRDKLKAELRAEIEAENKEKLEAAIKNRSEIPGTLSNDRAAGANTQKTYAPPVLQDLIGN